MTTFRALACFAFLPLWAACGEDEAPAGIAFEGRVNDQAFECNRTFSGVGTTETVLKPLDFRLYVHDVKWVLADGQETPFLLKQDGVFQRDNVALLDFETGDGTCETGSPEVHTTLDGIEPPPAQAQALVFTVGLPPELNHLDAAREAAPFNVIGLWWSWAGGYKFARIDVATDANPEGFYFHLGGTGCGGNSTEGYRCDFANQARIELPAAPLLSGQAVQVQLAALYQGLDLNKVPEPPNDSLAGCMAFPGDPECPAMFAALGLTYLSNDPAPEAQRLFQVTP